MEVIWGSGSGGGRVASGHGVAADVGVVAAGCPGAVEGQVADGAEGRPRGASPLYGGEAGGRPPLWGVAGCPPGVPGGRLTCEDVVLFVFVGGRLCY